MSREQTTGKKGKYYFVFDGAFRTSVDSNHPEAIRRINKKEKEVFEREVPALFGRIEDVSFYDGDFGRNLLITLDPNEEGETPIISFGADTRDAEDVMKKLPYVDFSKEIRISPYRFKPEDSDKERSGISIFQQDDAGNFTVKLTNDFFTKVEEKEGENGKIKKVYTNLHGFPSIDWDNSSDAERKIHWIKVNDFLQTYTKNETVPKLQIPSVHARPPQTLEEQEARENEARGFPKKKSHDASEMITADDMEIPF